ncbi:DUF5703 domain-containing protein [Bacteroides finegoldii]|uniref:DUF5703 domain-containing protein n=1 Tax=Bacteroides finegoldii TaxID=338188 RepID=A0A7J4YSD0_9BACE|nr:DUF5703 domain-containing protein [Bacteroides finegoldii]KAA5217575.1 hypothetical protein F2Z28_08755 [Bacteroides finegoldii]KAA5222270.1 hypothetical protein F2Z16_05030 [Bacteroides finegoldii]KAA5226467.1 hypothetical protein F2Z20_07705 [Bacteroides finegoldii]KAA5231947.1 hypothetical protein F2Z22_03925 [Bacteroides finegoldii]KAA5236375.1 hypothetical protein F2Z17_01475 [Bacteroides finegoldii]
MNYLRHIFVLLFVFVSVSALWSQHANVIWNTPSRNSSESMPCGGGDIGMNIWVEEGDILFYLSRSGTFDENNCQLKQGRFRIRLFPSPFKDAKDFRQELKLKDGYVEVSAGGTQIQLWADVYHPVVHVEITNAQPLRTEVSYENWRYKERMIRKGEGQQCSYKWAPPKGAVTTADFVSLSSKRELPGMTKKENLLLFYHRNPEQTVFDIVVAQQGMENVKSQMMNPLKHLTFGGYLFGDNLEYTGTTDNIYAGTDYRAWNFRSSKVSRKEQFCIVLHTEQTATVEQWEQDLQINLQRIAPQGKISSKIVSQDKKQTRLWWNAFWQRSFIEPIGDTENKNDSDIKEITRNYTLFRYMLGCNAYGSVPTKFNGGLFTFDPCHIDEKQAFTPDYRKWGGGTMTAQNQRLVYWPMLKSGDFDMMSSQFDFYNRMLKNAELRTQVYWQHNGACFCEQIENYGLPNPAEYGFKRPEWFDKGVEYNAWLEYEWDTILEFCQMILETKNYANADITPYLPLIESSLTFFDEHYRQLASRRGRKALDGNGQLVLFPGSACETYKMTNNASSTIAALRTVLENYGKKDEMLKTIPPIPLRYIEIKDSLNPTASPELKQTISPAVSWERINNVETPQLYPVFPWRIYGVGKENLELARNTYFYDPEAIKFRSHVGWKQDNIWAACLGLTEEAKRLTLAKLSNGPHRFPAFWGPGYDWTPDHNWGGSGMIGLQEMLLQTNGEQILLFPAWSKEWDIHFKLHAPGETTVEATLKDGKVTDLKVLPESRKKDIIIMI